MLTAILRRPGVIELLDSPLTKPGEGELLVRVKAALTCGTDLKAFLRGHALIPMPGPFGHEFSGIVEAKGKGVRRFRNGDAVMAVHSAPCLKCTYCGRGLFNLCGDLMSSKVLGAFAEYLLIPAHVVRQNVFRKPADLSFEEAAFLEPLACVVHGMERLSLKRGDTVLIMGAGPIGLLHLLLAKAEGAKVLMAGLEDDRLRVAERLGAEQAFLPQGTAEAVDAATGGVGVDAVIECTGQQSVWESSVDYVRRGGAVVLFGGCKKGTTVTYSADRLHYDEITLQGTFHFTPGDVRCAFSLLKNRIIPVRELITGTFPLSRVEDAFSLLRDGKGIKYAIIP